MSEAIAADAPVEYYRSKVDHWLAAVIVVADLGALGIVGWVALEGGPWLIWGFVLMVVSAGLSAWIIAGTLYTLDDDLLRIRCGPLRWDIPVSAITSVTTTRDPRSSPALSLDRLRVEYGIGQSILISPAEKDRFMSSLQHRRGAWQP